MADLSTPFRVQEERTSLNPPTAEAAAPVAPPVGEYDDEVLLALWTDIKAECMDGRWTRHRQCQRNLWYTMGRQWIEYQASQGGWRDKRMAGYIPRPVTNKCKETVTAIRAMFTSIALSVNIRPNGASPENVAVAAIADQLAPLLHETHHMNDAMSEFDFWLCTTGNAFLHTYMDYDIKHGLLTITAEECLGCGGIYPSTELTGAQPVCPDCQGSEFQTATHPVTGEPIMTTKVKGIPATMVLSELELSFPESYTRFAQIPYVVRSRWRTKRYYQNHPVLKDLVPSIKWQTSPQDQNLALFATLGTMNDMGVNPTSYGQGGSSNDRDEGIPEHEVWMRPTVDYPEGLVFRVAGDGTPTIIHLEEQENLPGPLPYKDAEGNPLFTFAHATFEHMGGRILGSSPLDVIIEKQDQLNQLDSYVLLCLSRMANPVWLEPKGAEIQKITGLPGLVIKWNPLTVQGNAKPERIPGVPLDASWMQLREQYIRDIEELAGTFDVIKGQKPAGVEAFSALQLLVERSQARFSGVFASRGDAYKNWVKFALELEREFGPEERTKPILTPARGYTFQTFKRAQLQGCFSAVVEDGSSTPKTSLGMRSAVQHGADLGMLNMLDTDQQYEGLKLFGLQRFVPSLDIHKQAALQKQQEFEEWVKDPQVVDQFLQEFEQTQAAYQEEVAGFAAESAQAGAPADPLGPPEASSPMAVPPPPPPMLTGTPLEWFPWFDAQIHMQEFLKWANDDHIRELRKTTPVVVQLLKMHLQEIQGALALLLPPPGAGGAGPEPSGSGRSMSNSNQNAGQQGKKSSGSSGTAAPTS
jgi:hypothetical protein